MNILRQKVDTKNSRIHPGFEDGAALVTAVVVTAVLMVMAGAVYFVSSREETMTFADLSGNQAFYYAEGGLETTINVISTEAATEFQLTQPREDDSPDGSGYLMDPDPELRQNPSDPVRIIVGDDSYTVWVDMIDENGAHCTDCGLNLMTMDPAYLRITAEGQTSEGYRKLQQTVKVEASSYPLTFYIDGDIISNGTPLIANQSIYVKGNVYGRSKIDVTGEDMFTGGGAGVMATGTIYSKSNGGNSQIYTASGGHSSYWNSEYINDRDSRGPTGNTFSLEELQSLIHTEGLSSTQLEALKSQAQNSGYYRSASSGFSIQQGDLPVRDGNVVVFVEFPSGNPANNLVDLKFTWPSADTGLALIIVLNGSVKMTGTAIGHLHGIVYCPNGVVTAHGGGNGDYTGFVWGKGMVDIGNFNFYMNEGFLEEAPFFAWTVTRENAWVEVDR